ncbi:MAG: hypothetical protein IPH06_12945 [Alphaproteobacteria bacterium]|nr:hypothetical protein [Alphaproteobacteria bacterium]MBK6897487.1 hypothetical protein [Alphaproteobacteria bacterium]QQS56368.1 MAG: hypothetical protein IPN28_08700 [Alphaproteobacteria bacterium]QQS56946.1 MAG: hypothetical protein IPN28_11915 [Alphaproteobacteria bacterium]
MTDRTHDPGNAQVNTQAPAQEAAKAPQPESNRPEDVLRDGNIKATIWKNERENGPAFSTVFSRTWQDDEGAYRDSHSFSGTELLRVSELARDAYTRTNALRQEHRVEITREESHTSKKEGDPELPYDERSDLAAFKAKRDAQSKDQPRNKGASRRK